MVVPLLCGRHVAQDQSEGKVCGRRFDGSL
jgi:hypothetical protein